MRTTINLPDSLIQQAKRFAARSGTTLTAVIEESLRKTLGQQKTPIVEKLKLKAYGRHGTFPGIDLDNANSLLETMERDDGSY